MREGFPQRREVVRGDVTMEVNSKRMTSNRFVDRSRLGYHEELLSGANPNADPAGKPVKPASGIPKGPTRLVENSIEDNARTSAGAMIARSSFSNQGMSRKGDAGCLLDCNDGPLTKKWGDRS